MDGRLVPGGSTEFSISRRQWGGYDYYARFAVERTPQFEHLGNENQVLRGRACAWTGLSEHGV